MGKLLFLTAKENLLMSRSQNSCVSSNILIKSLLKCFYGFYGILNTEILYVYLRFLRI